MITTSDTSPDPRRTNQLPKRERSRNGIPSNEIEAKFLIQDPASIPALLESLESARIEIHPQPPLEVVDRYLDSAGWQVLQAGWSLRWRDASGKCKVGLKSVAMNGDAVQHRTEVEQSVNVIPSNRRRLPDGPVAEALGDTGKLRELFRVHNDRRLFNIRTEDGALIEMAVDHVTVTAVNSPEKRASGRLEFDELELELKEGTEESLTKLAETMEQQFGLLPSRLSKFERGLQCAGQCPPPHIRPDTRRLEEVECVRQLHARGSRKKDPVGTLAFGYLLEQFEAMLLHEPRAWEGLDVEGVHQMRVATRRIRAAMRAFKRVLPADQVKSFRDEFKWVAGVLGDVRDLDVYQDNFQQEAAEIPAEDGESLIAYRNHIAQQRQIARKQLIDCLTSQRYRQLKERFTQFLRSGACETVRPSKRSIGKTESIGKAARQSILKRYKRLLRDGRAIQPDSPDEALHALRIDCKRMRYLLEFFRPTYGKSLSPFIRRLTTLQNVLGEFQDACVAAERLRDYADSVPMQPVNRGELITLGQLINRQRRLANDRRADFHEVWKRFDRKSRRNQIFAVLK